jgi:hypothetical protein
MTKKCDWLIIEWKFDKNSIIIANSSSHFLQKNAEKQTNIQRPNTFQTCKKKQGICSQAFNELINMHTSFVIPQTFPTTYLPITLLYFHGAKHRLYSQNVFFDFLMIKITHHSSWGKLFRHCLIHLSFFHFTSFCWERRRKRRKTIDS